MGASSLYGPVLLVNWTLVVISLVGRVSIAEGAILFKCSEFGSELCQASSVHIDSLYNSELQRVALRALHLWAFIIHAISDVLAWEA